MPSIKPTPPLELARCRFRWWGELQSWILAAEAGTPPRDPQSFEYRTIQDAQLVFRDCLERTEKILNSQGDRK